MSTWHRLLFDLLCPSFLYAIAYSTFFMMVIYGALTFLKIENPKWKSFLYLFPLFVPLAVFILFPPQVTMVMLQISSADYSNDLLAAHAFSITGLLCLTGLITSLTALAGLYIFGRKLVYWLQEVIELDPENNPALFTVTERITKCAGVSMPRLGLTEDLRPNAFTIGYGNKTTIVCTLGLLNMLTERELEAVIAHEVAHIKNRDFHFYVLTLALQIISFFNPLAYFLAAAIRRERERFADRTGMTFLKQPAALGLALTKIWDASSGVSGKRLRGWISGLFISYELKLAHKSLSNHPEIENRLRDLIKSQDSHDSRQKEILRIGITCALILSLELLIFVPLIQIPGQLSTESNTVHAFGLQTVTNDVSPTTFVLDSSFLRITSYFRICDNLQIYKHYRIIYLPSYPDKNQMGWSTIFTTSYPNADHFASILIRIVTSMAITTIMMVLIQVCFTDVRNAREAQLHKKIKIKG